MTKYNKEQMIKDLKVKEDIDNDGSKILHITISYNFNDAKTIYISLNETDNLWKEYFPSYYNKKILTLTFLKSLIK